MLAAEFVDKENIDLKEYLVCLTLTQCSQKSAVASRSGLIVDSSQ
jgi:hypothetical protein